MVTAPTVLNASVTLTEGRAAPRSPAAIVNDTPVAAPMAAYGTPVMTSRSVLGDVIVVIFAALAASALVGLESPETVQTTALLRAAGVPSVIRIPFEAGLPAVAAAVAPLTVQPAVGVLAAVNVGKPVKEIKDAVSVLLPVKLTVNVTEVALFAALLNVMEAV